MNKQINDIFNLYINTNLKEKIENNNLTYDVYIKLFNKLNKEFNNKKIYSYDINKFLINAPDIVKKFVFNKNYYIFKKAIKSSKWKDDMNNLQNINNNINKKKIENNYIK